jgi:glutamate dehydrogenase/leucine dehydrogenase/glycosyltransferase involved in cell wall biosynthesis
VSVLERVINDKESGLQSIVVIDSLKANPSACGGIRITPDISLDETRRIARSMTEKYALFGFSKSGGAKATLAIPSGTSQERRKALLQAFAHANKDILRSRTFIPWTDMGACPADVHTILDTAGLPRFPLENCGMTTAWSVFGSILGAADVLGKRMGECTAALEGFGNVGGVLAQELEAAGCKIVAISTSEGAIYEPKGLPIAELIALRDQYNSAFVRHTRFKTISKKQLLELPVTFLVPGARPHSITAATRVHASAVVPAANVPYTEDAAEAQRRRGVLCLPAELCYSGGHIGSRFLRYGFSEGEARAMSLRAWRKLIPHAARRSTQAGVSPDTYVKHVILRIMSTLRRSSLLSRAFEHTLRSPYVPHVLRRLGGAWYARHCFSVLHRRIDEALPFFAGAAQAGKAEPRAKASYAIVSPVRNEQNYLEQVIASVANQTVLPKQWVLVDDGSTDRTAEILQQAAQTYPWITIVTRRDRGYRQLGKGEAEAFADGYTAVKNAGAEFLLKLDGDVALPPHYAEALLAQFAQNPELGIASGAFSMPVKGSFVVERLSKHNTAAHARLYRKECFEDIGGLAPVLGFDTIDEVKARLRGWSVQSFKETKGLHLRPIASSTGAWWKGRAREGKAAYFCGAHPLFALARGVRLLARHPRLTGGLGYLAGYFRDWCRNAPRYREKDVRNAVRGHQLRRLLGETF